MKSKYEKDLFCATEHIGQKPQLILFPDSAAEAEWISTRVLELRDAGIDLNRQAILFRSTFVSIPLQVELTKRGIPFQVFGGMKFYEAAHIKDILAHLKVLLNPHDEISWARILTLMDGIGPRTASKIISSMERHEGLSAIAQDVLHTKFAHANSGSQIERLVRALNKAAEDRNDVERCVRLIMEYYDPIFKERFDDWNQRINDLKALLPIAAHYSSLQDFLAEFTIEPPEYGASREPRALDGEKPLTLSTIHSAKGLEWECVYLIGLIDGILPVSFSFEDNEKIEEEHRLFYVGVTRAKSILYLSFHYEGNGAGTTGFNKVSRFLDTPGVMACLDRELRLDYDI